ncbi:MFS transporter [Cryobacterium sinapicolor]|uniref:MFS transporter n=1 Tax=Cryobacterium sinapicolor TaxID=1259236 RepID=UPI00141AAEE1|nr:MFS transporter [Cryobacterium sinapicolor]
MTAEGGLSSSRFVLFGSSLGFSLAADGLWFILLSWLANRSGTALEASLVIAAGSLPRAALMLVGGTLVDRIGALLTAKATNGIRFLVLSVVTLHAVVGEINVPSLVLYALAFGLLDAIYLPAINSIPAVLVPRAALPAAQGVVQTIERLCMILASASAGLLLAGVGVAGTAAIGAAALLVSVVLLLPVRNGTESQAQTVLPKESMARELWSGLRRVAKDRVVGPLLVTIGALNLALSAPINIGSPRLAIDNGWGESGFGFLLAGFGVGAAAGAIVMVVWRPARAGFWGAVFAAVGAVLVGTIPWVPSLTLAVGLFALVGLCAGPAAALLIGLVQALTPKQFMGRTMALLSFAALGLIPVGYTAFGLLVSTFGAQVAYVSFGCLELAGALFALLVPEIRRASINPMEEVSAGIEEHDSVVDAQ